MTKSAFFLILLLSCWFQLRGQGVTTCSLEGKITQHEGLPLSGANITAVHLPSGTLYGAVSQGNGHYSIAGMRIGGPYRVSVSYLGYASASRESGLIALGSIERADFRLHPVSFQIGEEVIVGSPGRGRHTETGTATLISAEIIQSIPSVNHTLSDLIRLSPQYKNSSFLGQLNVLNNITIDGSSFNNSFGIAGQPGERTGVSPISPNALEGIRISVAPFDVKQSGFVGGAVNMVTKSGTNEMKGSVYFQTRNKSFIGTKAAGSSFSPGNFHFNLGGGDLSGPLIKDKLFFFLSIETESYVRPATTFLANDGASREGGNVTRVLESDLKELSDFLRQNFGYDPGAWQGYDFETTSSRYVIRLDYNLSRNNKLSLRYNHLDSSSDQFVANHNVLGYGFRRGTTSSLNFQNSNYAILENIRSLIAEWNSRFSANVANNMIVGYRAHNESRDNPSRLFPFVDILKDGSTYTSFGTEPFSSYSSLKYQSFQFQNNLTVFLNRHSLLFGFNLERYHSEDCFFPGAQSVYVFNSLSDFYTDARDYLAHPDRTVSTVNLKRFQYRYSNIPGKEIPFQPLTILYGGVYLQDRWNLSSNFNLTLGLRADLPVFDQTGYRNPEVEKFAFRDEKGREAHYSTSALPRSRPLFSPRIGFDWELPGESGSRISGGSGFFTGQPAYVWISNQIGNNGMLTGFQQYSGSAQAPLYGRPFNPRPDAYRPATVSGEPAGTYELALTDPGFRFPQIWRTNLAASHPLPGRFTASLDLIYDRDIHGVSYINANLPTADNHFTGADHRGQWTSGNRIISKIPNAVILKNHSAGYAWNVAASLERQLKDGFYAKIGYAYGITKSTTDPTSVASASWAYNPHSGDPNNPGLSYSSWCPDHRFFGMVSLKKSVSRLGPSVLSAFFDAFNSGRASYLIAGDMNGDGGSSNDLIYIHRSPSEIRFQPYTSGTVTYSSEAQNEAWESYIRQDKYLRRHRGSYAERNGVVLPMVARIDLSLSQEFRSRLTGKKNALILRLDILNATNILNRNWGVAKAMQTVSPLIWQGTDPQGNPLYRLREVNNQLISRTFTRTANLTDVYRMQLSVKWIFTQ